MDCTLFPGSQYGCSNVITYNKLCIAESTVPAQYATSFLSNLQLCCDGANTIIWSTLLIYRIFFAFAGAFNTSGTATLEHLAQLSCVLASNVQILGFKFVRSLDIAAAPLTFGLGEGLSPPAVPHTSRRFQSPNYGIIEQDFLD